MPRRGPFADLSASINLMLQARQQLLVESFAYTGNGRPMSGGTSSASAQDTARVAREQAMAELLRLIQEHPAVRPSELTPGPGAFRSTSRHADTTRAGAQRKVWTGRSLLPSMILVLSGPAKGAHGFG